MASRPEVFIDVIEQPAANASPLVLWKQIHVCQGGKGDIVYDGPHEADLHMLTGRATSKMVVYFVLAQAERCRGIDHMLEDIWWEQRRLLHMVGGDSIGDRLR